MMHPRIHSVEFWREPTFVLLILSQHLYRLAVLQYSCHIMVFYKITVGNKFYDGFADFKFAIAYVVSSNCYSRQLLLDSGWWMSSAEIRLK